MMNIKIIPKRKGRKMIAEMKFIRAVNELIFENTKNSAVKFKELYNRKK